MCCTEPRLRIRFLLLVFLLPGFLSTIEVEVVDGVGWVVVVVVNPSFYRVELNEPGEYRDVLSCSHFDRWDHRHTVRRGALSFDRALMLTQPAIIKEPVLLSGTVPITMFPSGS